MSRWAWALAAGLLVAAFLAALTPDALVGAFYDDGLYTVLAKSLAEGSGYRFLHLPDAPPATHYPFGYPLFLAALWRLSPDFPANVTLFRAANAVLMGLFAAVTVRHLGERTASRMWLGALVIAVSCVAVPLAATATVLFAEPLFLVLAALALWAADSCRDHEDGRSATIMAVLAGTAAGLSILTRSIGVAVLCGVVLALRRRPRRAGAAAVMATALVLPWALWVRSHAGELDPALASNYGTYGDLVRQSGFGWLSPGILLDIARPLGALALPGLPGPVFVPALLLLAGGFIWGGVTLGSRSPAAAWTLAAYLLIVALWPYGPDRFLWAAFPWIALAMLAGMDRLVAAARAGAAGGRRLPGVLAAVFGILIVLGFGVNQVRGHVRGAATSEQRGISATMQVAVDWVRAATDSSAVIATEDEALIWLYTDRRAVPSYLWRARGRGSESLGADSLRAYLTRTGATHLLLTGRNADAAPTIDELVGRYPGMLRLVRVWEWGMLAFEVAQP